MMMSTQSIFALNSADILIERVSSPYFYLETTNPSIYTGVTATSPRAAYVAFRVKNIGTTTLKDLKARLNTFQTIPSLNINAGTLGLVGGSPMELQDIGGLAPGQSDIVYWLVQYPKQAISGTQYIGCKMTITVYDAAPGTASLCEAPPISMRTVVSSGAAFNTSIANGVSRVCRSVVGSINDFTVTFNFSSLSTGDEINLQPIGNVSFLASIFQLTSAEILSSTVPGVSAGDIDKIYYSATSPVTNASITVKYHFNNISSSTNPVGLTTINPYAVQSNSVPGTPPVTTSVFSNNFLNAAASTNFATYNSLPFVVSKTSLTNAAAPGATVGYRVVIKNISNEKAAFQRIEDLMAKGFTFVGMSAGSTLTSSLCSNSPTAGFINSNGTTYMNWSGFVNNAAYPFKEFVISAHDSLVLIYQAQVPNPTGLNKLFVNSLKIYYGAYATAAVTSNICVNCGDVDGDGSFDMVDQDDDNDGVQDDYEICGGCYGTNPMGDDDDDMNYNYKDSDTQGYVDLNGDLINDKWDADMDGIINTMDKDSDGDGISDLVEAGGLDNNSDGTVDSFLDDDGDGVTNMYDADYIIGIPIATWDSDHDGNFNYLDKDSDYDGVQDVTEAGYTDLDGDGKIDGAANNRGICNCVIPDSGGVARIITGMDFDGDNIPNDYVAGDNDLDGKPDYMDIDADGDGIVDLLETQPSGSSYVDVFDGLNTPIGTDSDHDGLDNVYELFPVTAENSNGVGSFNAQFGTPDNTPDYLDRDSDGDGIDDSIEGFDADYNGVPDILPIGYDSDQDGLDDAYDVFDLFAAIGAVAQDNIRGNNATLDEETGLSLPYRMWRSFGQPLPVVLKDLKATPMANSILVSWNTLSEISSDHFTVERSIDGTNFEALGDVTSKGGINTKTAYSFDDKKAVNDDIFLVYYRVRMVDKNGASVNSERVSVALPTADLAVAVFPNPTKSELNVNYYLKEASDVTIRINNVAGKEVYSNTITGGQLLQNAKVDVSHLPTGIYFLSIKNAGANKVVKFVVE